MSVRRYVTVIVPCMYFKTCCVGEIHCIMLDSNIQCTRANQLSLYVQSFLKKHVKFEGCRRNTLEVMSDGKKHPPKRYAGPTQAHLSSKSRPHSRWYGHTKILHTLGLELFTVGYRDSVAAGFPLGKRPKFPMGKNPIGIIQVFLKTRHSTVTISVIMYVL